MQVKTNVSPLVLQTRQFSWSVSGNSFASSVGRFRGFFGFLSSERVGAVTKLDKRFLQVC